MKGTYQLLKYVINEYLIQLSNSKILNETSNDIINKVKEKLKNITF
jgi:hypothetical protein